VFDNRVASEYEDVVVLPIMLGNGVALSKVIGNKVSSKSDGGLTVVGVVSSLCKDGLTVVEFESIVIEFDDSGFVCAMSLFRNILLLLCRIFDLPIFCCTGSVFTLDTGQVSDRSKTVVCRSIECSCWFDFLVREVELTFEGRLVDEVGSSLQVIVFNFVGIDCLFVCLCCGSIATMTMSTLLIEEGSM
jgi:hypothetical protein